MSADLQILKDEFSAYTTSKQVIVYAEALRLERYELLAVIDKCITPDRRPSFTKAVEQWLSPKNQLDYEV